MKETITYTSGIPISVRLFSAQRYPLHYNDDLQLVYILEGSIVLKVTFTEYHLEKGDIHIIHADDVHGIIQATRHNLIMVISIDMKKALQSHPNIHTQTFSTKVNDYSISIEKKNQLIKKIHNILKELNEQPIGFERRTFADTLTIIDMLYDSFRNIRIDRESKTYEHITDVSDSFNRDRILRIMHYISKNCPYKITLAELAEKEHLNRYYFSHYFHEQTGLNFKDFLNMSRVEMSERLLLDSNISIPQIAAEVGFSKTVYYIEAFKTWYNMPPSEYRKLYSSFTIKHMLPNVTEYSLAESLSYLDSENLTSDQIIDLNVKGVENSPDFQLTANIVVNNKLLSDNILRKTFVKFVEKNYSFNYIIQSLTYPSEKESESIYREENFITEDIISLILKIKANRSFTIPFFDNERGHGLVTTNGLIKPSYFIVEHFSSLQGKIVFDLENGIVTMKRNSAGWILYNKKKEIIYYRIKLPSEVCHCRVTTYIINSENKLYELCKSFGAEYILNKDDVDIINNATWPDIRHRLHNSKGTDCLEIEIGPGEASCGMIQFL